MAKKVFGFIKANKEFEPTKKHGCYVFTYELVPVVSLEWLEDYLATHESIRDCVDRGAMLLAAKKEAEK